MGDAKRRKELDPSYATYNPKITIAESSRTNNFLVLVDGHCVDSSIHLGEAEAVKRWIETEHHLNPIKRQAIKNQSLHSWIVNSPRYASYPTTTAEIIAVNPDSGQLETLLLKA
jgi:hypothetical protein